LVVKRFDMDLQKINVKFFLGKGAEIPLGGFIPVFHRWIQEDQLEGMLVDVAEYTHVSQGPGVLLIAHEGNYSLDEMDGKRGLLYNHKRGSGKSEGDYLKMAFARALKACVLLEKESGPLGEMRFTANHLQVFVNDRLAASPNSEGHGKLEEILNPFLNWLYDGEKYLLIPERNPQKRAGFEVKVEKDFAVEDLLKKLSSN
jgi:hypothetical protein